MISDIFNSYTTDYAQQTLNNSLFVESSYKRNFSRIISTASISRFDLTCFEKYV